MEFYEKSYDVWHVTVAHCGKKFLYERPLKYRKNHEYSKKIEKIEQIKKASNDRKKLRKILEIQPMYNILLEISFNF